MFSEGYEVWRFSVASYIHTEGHSSNSNKISASFFFSPPVPFLFLKLFKQAKVIMILKPGKPPTAVASYRPISLLPILSKILEKLLLTRMANDPHFQDWTPSHQFGFRKAHSTIQQCHRITDIINRALEGKKILLCGIP